MPQTASKSSKTLFFAVFAAGVCVCGVGGGIEGGVKCCNIGFHFWRVSHYKGLLKSSQNGQFCPKFTICVTPNVLKN